MSDQIPYFRIVSALTERPWAITPRMMETMIETVLNPDHMTVDALASKLGRPLEKTGGRVEVRGSTAILGIEGPIFRYANLFTAISGATSMEMAAQDLELNINSPGGEVDGTAAFADMVRAGSERKPVFAYVDGMAASAAYWIASAAPKIIAQEGSWVGSIGVVATTMDNRGAQERQGVKRYSIVSSQSPKKNPDVATDAGRAQIQELVDEIAAMFIGRVAAYRGVSAETVQSDFGQGGLLPTRLAKERGMIDSVQGYEAFLAGISNESRFISMAAPAAKENNMAETNAAPQPQPTAAAPAPPPQPAAAAAPAPSNQAERERIQAILNHPEAEGRRDLAQHLAFQHDMSVEQAAMVLKASPKAAQPAANAETPLSRAMAQIPNPNVHANAEPAGEADQSDEAEARRVLAFVPANRKVAAR